MSNAEADTKITASTPYQNLPMMYKWFVDRKNELKKAYDSGSVKVALDYWSNRLSQDLDNLRDISDGALSKLLVRIANEYQGLSESDKEGVIKYVMSDQAQNDKDELTPWIFERSEIN